MQGMLQADFANEYIGGGVLGYGCVQEEIRFVINPECLISMYYSSNPMNYLESIVILGPERFTNYLGYARSFRCQGPYEDKTNKIIYKGETYVETTITAIDALAGPTLFHQYSPSGMMRELNKAYSGFRLNDWENPDASVATGNWGCGAFGGDIHLKSMLQWIAASAADRKSVDYFTFSDPGAEGLKDVVDALLESKATVGRLIELIEKFAQSELRRRGLFSFLMKELRQKSTTEDDEY
eukprot:TRINITY_DN542_c0_g1_i10.p1 TRINITY_DN542_c0_g1~~TRINITY_DN542_c0_g1_i10.p1  ORF type:complete len:239 (+),score=32.60 TRINITY_DN542_c0_g1_i10:426-1142(+)